jgi:hypothetical protein
MNETAQPTETAPVVAELVAQLREPILKTGRIDDEAIARIENERDEAADALEAQARRIRELEAGCEQRKLRLAVPNSEYIRARAIKRAIDTGLEFEPSAGTPPSRRSTATT